MVNKLWSNPNVDSPGLKHGQDAALLQEKLSIKGTFILLVLFGETSTQLQ